jgi:biotin synthase-related radical SAM superfamily protein
MTLEDLTDTYGDELLKMDGFDDCIAGVCLRFGQEPVIIYDRAKVISKLMEDGCTEEEAEEFHEFNQAGAWVGERTPAFLVRLEK